MTTVSFENGTFASSKADLVQDELAEENVLDTRCGYVSSCKPGWLQKCANAKAYLLIASLSSIVQGFAVNGVNNVNISSYERRYLLTSKDSGLVASFFDVAAALTVIFVGYFGGSGHQPRILGAGVASIALGTFVMSLTHFTSPPYKPYSGISLACDISASNSSLCLDTNADVYLKNYLYLLLLGQALNGFGSTCLYSLGVTYLDQSVSAKMAPLYIGLMVAASAVGPAIGYIVGGALLEIYVDFPKKPPEGLTSADPGWVGAWWLGFVISAVLAAILALFICLFPRELPGTAEIRAAKASEAHHDGSEEKVNVAGFGLTFRDMPMAAWYLIKNPAFMCIAAVKTVEINLNTGFSTFLAKYISNQFAQTSSWSAILLGLMAVPSAAVALLLGGYLCKRWQLKVTGILKLTAISSFLVILLSPIYWARCEEPSIAGLQVGYPGSLKPDRANLSSTCNEGCGCSTALYEPVCSNGTQYFSPCYAGCHQRAVGGVYHNCECPGVVPTLDTTATSGPCHIDCVLLYAVFVPFGCLLFFFTFFIGTPMTVATIRVVPEKQRAFGIALQWVVMRLLGSIPGPIIIGALIDASCVLWENDCDVRGSCWVYDNFNMSMRLFIFIVGMKLLSIGFTITGYFVYKPPPDETEIHDNNRDNSVTSLASIPPKHN